MAQQSTGLHNSAQVGTHRARPSKAQQACLVQVFQAEGSGRGSMGGRTARRGWGKAVAPHSACAHRWCQICLNQESPGGAESMAGRGAGVGIGGRWDRDISAYAYLGVQVCLDQHAALASASQHSLCGRPATTRRCERSQTLLSTLLHCCPSCPWQP